MKKASVLIVVTIIAFVAAVVLVVMNANVINLV